ncbi:MAG: DsbC family protein [Gammaproteobacteria bacterium]
MNRQRAYLFVLLAAIAAPVGADAELERRLTAKVKSILPDAEIQAVSASAIPGMYEVMVDGDLLYLTGDGRYALQGELMDLEQRRNLSEERRSEVRRLALGAVDVNKTIEFAPQNPKHALYVFTDVDCSYCRRMHAEIDQLLQAGISVRYLAYPRAGLGSESYDKTVSVWCAKDRQKALSDAKLGKSVQAAKCDAPVAEQFKLGQRLGVKGTPATFLENGEQVGGYVPPPQLLEYLNKGS